MNEFSYTRRPVRRSDTIVIVGVFMLLLLVAIIAFGMVNAPSTPSAEPNLAAKPAMNVPKMSLDINKGHGPQSGEPAR
jgi:hypothetical protein